jgi:ADP-heptose:LPS heptosyltransferase
MTCTDAPVLLILRALGLGDLLTSVPALRALSDAFPKHTRILATPSRLAALARHTGAVNEILPAAPLSPLDASIRPDIAVNFHGSGPQSHRVLLAASPRRLIAFAHPDVPETSGFPRWHPMEHDVDRWCRLLQESGIPADRSRFDMAPPARPVPAGAAGATLIHPGAASAARRWPVERWARVARWEVGRGRPVFVTGSPSEGPLARRLARLARLDDQAVLAGATDVMDLAAVVAAAGLVLSTDTGIAHLATAMGTPSVVLFGPTSPAEWGPPPHRDRHLALWAGSIGDPHAGRVDDGLLKLQASDVIEACRSLELAQTGGRT